MPRLATALTLPLLALAACSGACRSPGASSDGTAVEAGGPPSGGAARSGASKSSGGAAAEGGGADRETAAAGEDAEVAGPASTGPRAPFPRAEEREAMVREQMVARDLTDPRVLAAMRAVPRHLFVPASERPLAYEDVPLRIGHGQTISQPYIVALMSSLADVSPGDKVLEVGTGSGYQAAVLAELGAEVYSIEIVEPLADRAAATLAELGYENVHVRQGDGYAGWPSEAPFDAVVVTAAPPEIPRPLKDQLGVGGKLVIPVGRAFQSLEVHTLTEDGWRRRTVAPVRFVPMTGRAQED